MDDLRSLSTSRKRYLMPNALLGEKKKDKKHYGERRKLQKTRSFTKIKKKGRYAIPFISLFIWVTLLAFSLTFAMIWCW